MKEIHLTLYVTNTFFCDTQQWRYIYSALQVLDTVILNTVLITETQFIFNVMDVIT